MKEKMLKIFQSKYTYYLLVSVFAILLSASDLKLKLNKNEIYSNKCVFILGIIGVIVAIIYFIISIYVKKKELKHHTIFLLFSLTIGLMYIGASPLFTGSDEHNHYYRIYEITEGNFTTPVQKDNTVGDKLPKSLYNTFTNYNKDNINRNIKIKYSDEFSMMKQKLKKNDKMQYGLEYATEYSNTALYCPIQYFPQIIGFLIGKIFSLGPFWLGELGRIFNLLFYVFICYFFLKKLPRLKTFAVLVLLSPTLLSNATTLSADAFTNALIFGFLTLIICNFYNKKRLSNWEKFSYLLISILLASCKIVYLPFVFLLFILPEECFKSKKEKLSFNIIIILLSCLVGIIWMNYTNIYFDSYYVNTEIQKKNILSNILWYFVVVFRTYMTNFNALLLNVFVGNNMYHSQLPVYSFLSVIYIIIVVISYFIKEKDKKYEKTNFNFWQNIFIILIMLGVLALLTTAIYIQCTANFISVNNPVVVGLQGRYYLAFVLCLLLIGIKPKLSIKKDSNYILLDISLLIHLFVLLQMIVCFVI